MYNANSDGWCREALSDTQFGQALDDAGLGGEAHGVLRAWFFQTLATDKGTNARDWTRFDRTIAIAKAKGYKVIPTLTDQWGECGADATPTYSFKTEAWYTGGYTSPDPGLSAPGAYGAGWLSYRDWVAEVVARYENEPAILAWQLINEAEVNPGGAFGACPPGNGPRDELKTWASDCLRPRPVDRHEPPDQPRHDRRRAVRQPGLPVPGRPRPAEHRPVRGPRLLADAGGPGRPVQRHERPGPAVRRARTSR